MADTGFGSSRHRWPLASATARLLFVRACCAVEDGADVLPPHSVRQACATRCPAGECVAVVLGDREHRVSALGGHEGMPRSLGSTYGGFVARFLGGSLRGVVGRVIDTPGVESFCNGVAVSRDGSTLLVSDSWWCGSHTIHEFALADGSLRRVMGGEGDGPVEFKAPHQLCFAPDGFVFVAECDNDRVQVLTPTLDFHCFIGEGEIKCPIGVAASADIVVASGILTHGIYVFSRSDGALLRRFGCRGSGEGQLEHPCGLCLISGDRHVAVTDKGNDRVSVFSVDGEFIRHVGVGVLKCPKGVAASAFDELVVADTGSRCVRVFSSAGDLVASVGEELFTGVVVFRSTVLATEHSSETVYVFS
jgi:hypothetical protein